MKIRNPPATASIWSSGKITVTGSSSEETARISARKVARVLQKMGYKVRMHGFRIINVLATVDFPFGIRLREFAQTYPKICWLVAFDHRKFLLYGFELGRRKSS